MKFTNHSRTAVRVAKIGWIQPGESFEVEKGDDQTINSIKGLSFFEDSGAASPPKTAKKKSSKGSK